MKICFFIGDISHRAGTERVTTIIANGLAEKGHSVYIMSLVNSTKSAFELHKDIEIIALKNGSGNNKKNFIPLVRELRQVLKKYSFDVIIEADVILRMFTFLALVGLKTSVISWEHFNYNVNLGVRLRDFARKIAARSSDYIVTLTETDKRNYEKNLKCLARVRAIENPLVFYPENQSTVENKIVFSAGRFEPQKGFDLLIEAWKKISSKYPDWTLRIAGDGVLKPEIMKQCEELNLSESVKFIGAINEIDKEYEKAAVYAMSSRFEGFGMVLIEAMSFGVPVVSFDCPHGPSDIIENDVDGILVEPENTDKLAQSLGTLMENYELRKSMGKAARNNIQRFSRDNILKKWEEILSTLEK